MAQVTNYQCPACTGPLHFSSKENKLKCDYCGSVYEVSQIDAMFNKKVDSAKEEAENKQEANQEKWETTGLHSYTCSSCNAEIICDENTVATSCPYCANPTVIPSQFTGGRMPEYVIPFAFDNKQAKEALKNHYKKKKLLPDVFVKENHIEDIKGIYVPFWLYDGNADVEMSFSAEKKHTTRTQTEERITTEHYNCYREGNVSFRMVPVDASKKMDNDLMDSIEPFDYSKLVEYSPSYLPGYFAESYDESEQDCKPRSDLRVTNSSYAEIESTVTGYDSVARTASKIQINYTKITYAFMPVWLLSTKWKDQTFMFSMNGQTGKFVGNLPVDWGKFWKRLIGYTVAGTAILTPIVYLLMGNM